MYILMMYLVSFLWIVFLSKIFLLFLQMRAISRKYVNMYLANDQSAVTLQIIFNHITIIYNKRYDAIVCVVKIFVWGGLLRPTWEFFTHLETSPLLVKSCKFWPILGSHGHWQWGFFSVPHILWHGSFVYIGHLQGPVTLGPIAERLAVEICHYYFNDFGLPRPEIEPRSPACEAEALTLR